MTRRMLTKRLRARLRGERGFTIVETVVAITVIFGSLTALAYTATIGFRYIAFGRDRIQATGYANEIMEGIRALPYASITKGLDTAEYSSDPNIELCGADYRLFTCAGEKLVGQTFSGGYTEDWLVPHTGTTTTDNGLLLTWATYVTNDDVAANPYSVTVEVSWEGGGAIAANVNSFVRVQSAFWSPTGCVSSTSHPFAAPCQPFFYGQALIPASTISLEGQFHESAVDYEEGTLGLPGAEASLQQEQVTAARCERDDVLRRGDRRRRGASRTDSSRPNGPPTRIRARTRSRPTVDRRPSAPVDTSSDSSPTRGARSEPSSRRRRAIPRRLGSRDRNSSWPTRTPVLRRPAQRETDSLPCSAIRTQFGGFSTVVAPLTHVVGALGPATLVKVGPAPSASTGTVDREPSATADEDGLVDSQATRTLGTIYIGGYPTAGMTPPAGMSASSAVFNNYCLRIEGYADSVRAIAGREHGDGAVGEHLRRNAVVLQRRCLREQGGDRRDAQHA